MVGMFEEEWEDTARTRRPLLLVRAILGLAISAVALRVRKDRGSGPASLRPGRAVARGGASSRRWLDDLRADLRLGARLFVKRPASALVIVGSLALGIGLNTAVFSLVNGLLLRPLPYANAAELLQLSETAPGIESMDVSLPDFHLWRERTTVFSGMFAFDDARFLLTERTGPEVLEGAAVSPGFLAVLGIQPVLGRGFLESEEQPGADGVVVISHTLWDRRFGRDPDVLGRQLILNGAAREIVGVAPPVFHFPEVAQVWVPLAFDPLHADPEDYGYDVIGRLSGGADLDAALAEGDVIVASLVGRSPSKAGIGVTAYPLRLADVPLAAGAMALALLVATIVVMLVACTNVASLLLARGEERRAEMSVRQALGASRGRLTRQALAESAVPVVLGISGALLLGHKAVDLLPALLPGERPYWIHFDLDHRVFGWSVLMGVLCCVFISLPAAHQAARSRGGGSGQRVLSGRGRRLVVSTQIALATTLVASAGLTLRALDNLNRVDPGVDGANVLVLSAPLPSWTYPTEDARRTFYRDALGRVRALPGVTAAASIDAVPFLSTGQEVALDVGAGPTVRPLVGLLSRFSDGYFSALGIPVLEGRLPEGTAAWEGTPVAVVSRSLASRLWPGEAAVGQRLRHGTEGSRSPTVDAEQPWLTVVAVVGDVLQSGPGKPTREALYLPMGSGVPSTFTVLVRTEEDPRALAASVRERIHEIDPTLPFLEATTMASARRFSIWIERTISALLAGLGALAMLLSIVGVYGVISHIVGRRRREMGLRMAVGASVLDVQALVVRGALGLLLPGLVVGLVLSGALSVVFRAALFEVGALDPITLVATTVAFVLAGVVASYLPARRASRTDPATALRAE
jgi:putative ABC transport system permease protein